MSETAVSSCRNYNSDMKCMLFHWYYLVIHDAAVMSCTWMWLLLDGGSSSEMCQYERMQILGIRHPLPPTTSDAELGAR